MGYSRVILGSIVLASLLFSRGALAQSVDDPNRCDDILVQSVASHFHLEGFSYPTRGTYPSEENGGLIVAGVCKRWPTNASRTIAAFAYEGESEYEKQLLLVLVDTISNQIIASYKGVIPVDAASEVSSTSLWLDTARYSLTKTIRAFGLRINSFRDRCTYEGGFNNELTLYVIDGKTLRPVLSETMSRWRYGRGNRCGVDEVRMTQANVVISVENTYSNGFADLRLSAKSDDKRTPPTAVVKYDGKSYDLTPWSKAFGPWWEAADPDAP